MGNNTRIAEIIRCAKVLELNTRDEDVITCMVVALMCPDVDETNQGLTLNMAFTGQSSIFMKAVQQTSEFFHLKEKLLAALPA